MPGPLSAQIKADFPEIENAFRYLNGTKTIRKGDKKFNEAIVYTEEELFSVMTIEFVHGSAKNSLSDRHSIIITDKMALKYFDRTDVIGEILTLDENTSFKVSAVIKELPQNSSFRCDFCIPFEHVREIGFDYTNYGSNWNAIYVLLAEGADEITTG
jgi:putative ABC transport system permease protein